MCTYTDAHTQNTCQHDAARCDVVGMSMCVLPSTNNISKPHTASSDVDVDDDIVLDNDDDGDDDDDDVDDMSLTVESGEA